MDTRCECECFYFDDLLSYVVGDLADHFSGSYNI